MNSIPDTNRPATPETSNHPRPVGECTVNTTATDSARTTTWS